MINFNHPVIKHKAGLFHLSKELDDIPQAGQIMSMKPDEFYRNQRLMSDNDNSIASIGDGIRPISLIFKKLKLFP